MSFSPAQLLSLSKRIKAISQVGLTYSIDDYNLERYKELEHISYELTAAITDQPENIISGFYLNGKEYPTPKADIRAVVFNDQQQILLVREKEDRKWSLPGGWADIGYSPSEIAVKEVEEETGLIVKPAKLLAVFDKKFHPHPPELEYVYKICIRCIITGGQIKQSHDIMEAGFFDQENIPELSEKRVVLSQINLMFEFLHNPDKEVVFD